MDATTIINAAKKRLSIAWLLTHTVDHFVVIGFTALILLAWGQFAHFSKALPEAGKAILWYADTHPIRVSIAIAVSLLVILLAVIAIESYCTSKANIKNYIIQKRMLERIGLRAFFTHDTDNKQRSDWAHFFHDIKNNPTQHIDILAVTGKHTFGDSSVREFLLEFHGDVRILLIRPFCTAFKERAASLRKDEKDFALEIDNSIEFCKDLAKKGKSIAVKFYTHAPIWKIVSTDSFLWIQHYNPIQVTQSTPVYNFFSNIERTSLYFPLADSFQKRWRSKASELVDLKRKKKPSQAYKTISDQCVMVVTDDGHRWTVSPSFLRPAEPHDR